MGNCFRKKMGTDNDKSDPSRARASIADSTATTCSTPLTLAVPYSSHGSAGDCVPTPRTEGEILSYPSLKNFAFHELRVATRNFRPDSLIGEGGFGCVFKGRIDEKTLTAAKPGSGTVVAVKKLKPEGIQGDKEWMTEINYLGRLQHPNLVKLIGFSSEDDNRLLVYEFMPKGSLDNHLFRRGPVPLPWATRIKVAVGAAKGLAFLHDAKSQIIYRDVKAANILLDSDFNAKLSDFGLARAGPTGEMTHVSTRIVGSQGYAAPEYIIAGHLSARADVYSFGVVLLEILSGQRAFTEYKSRSKQFLVDWAKPYLRDNRNLSRIMDSKLEGRYSKKEAHAVADLALRCVSIEARRRPPMSVVLATLEQIQDLKCSGKALKS